MKSAGILFDYNGVIVTDEHVHKEALATVLKKYGIELSDEVNREHCVGRTDEAGLQSLQKVFPQLAGASIPNLISEKTKIYLRLAQESSLVYPGLPAKLKELHEYFAAGMVTGSLAADRDTVLEQENIRQYFDVIIGAEDIERSKPDPEGYLKGIAAIGIPKEKIVAVEDTAIGVQAAQAADLKCIAVLHTLTADKLEAADKIIEKVTDITPDMIRGLAKSAWLKCL